MKTTKILFVVTEDWYFFSHRLQLAVAAKEVGYEVAVATRVSSHRRAIEEAGVRVIPLKRMKRSSLNLFRELSALIEILFIFRRERPALVHLVALKPAIYGSLAAKIVKIPARVSALGGLGFVFSSNTYLAWLIKPFIVSIFPLIFNDKRSRLILQNQNDLSVLARKAKVDVQYIHVIRSAGVYLRAYTPSQLPQGVPIIMLASRMIWHKGIQEFVDAAQLLAAQGLHARFVLVGNPDLENPSSVTLAQLKKWQETNIVEWWGHLSDMPMALSQASVVCLPSYYGEGVPKVLIEAMACSRAIITTDTPGCNELVEVGINGLFAIPKDASDLASKIGSLIVDRSLCQRMGNAGRRIVEKHFSIGHVAAETFKIYDILIDQT